MNGAAEAPAWAAMMTAILLVAGTAITLDGSLGQLRLRTFYERIHAPTLGSTFGTACIVIASMIYFTAAGSWPVLYELLILLFVAVTPVTLMILVRAALSRDMAEDKRAASEEHGNLSDALRNVDRLRGGPVRISTLRDRRASSVTLPINAFSSPDRPCVPMTGKCGCSV